MTDQQDWRTLDAGDALDRIVAERLGWRLSPGIFASLYSSIFAPDSSQTGAMKTGANFGDYCVVQGQGWPRYSRDANAALGLTVNDAEYIYHAHLWHYYHPPHWRAEFCDEMPDDALDGEAGDTPALAIVRAWLAYHERIHA